MAKTKQPTSAKLLIGIMYAEEKICAEILGKLQQKFGEFKQGPIIDFNFTNYYEDETGKNLKKTYVVFDLQIKREQITAIKLLTNQLEQEFCSNGLRKINIDPGYITPMQVVLASAKEHPYRIHIADGIYGQIVLVYSRNNWIPVDKTFADYQQKEVQGFLISARNTLINRGKCL